MSYLPYLVCLVAIIVTWYAVYYLSITTSSKKESFVELDSQNALYNALSNRNGNSASDHLVYNQSDSSLSLKTNSKEKMRIANNGRIGIGTSAPNAKLQIVDGNNVVRMGDLRNGGSTAAIGLTDGREVIMEAHGSDMRLYTGGTLSDEHARMIIKENGFVGVNTLNPRNQLEVRGNVSAYADKGQMNHVTLDRIGQDNELHRWTFWHMDSAYGENDLHLYEYQYQNGEACADPTNHPKRRCGPVLQIKSGTNEMLVGNHIRLDPRNKTVRLPEDGKICFGSKCFRLNAAGNGVVSA
jgi:hypothetical protein